MDELVSVIMPCYNTADFIAESIRSIQEQTYSNWELIIVDDCSTDNTQDIVAGFGDPRIRYLRNETNSGAAVTRNRALSAARGRWIAFLDSDDLWDPEKLRRQVDFMVRGGYGFSYTGYREMNEDGSLNGVTVTGPKHITRTGMYTYCWPGCLTVMYDTTVTGLIQIPDIKKNNDYAIWLQVIEKADCYLLDQQLATYRKRAGSISSSGYLKRIRWHYRLFRGAMQMNPLGAFFCTGRNLVAGVLKKIIYVKRGG